MFEHLMIVEVRETYSCEIKCSIFIPLIIIYIRNIIYMYTVYIYNTFI